MNPAVLLFVDDEPALRVSTALVLESIGYQVLTAEDGIAALEVIERTVPDLIISDLKMPRMDGTELIRAVRTRFPDLPVIAITGEFSAVSPPQGLDCDAFFEKAQYTVTELHNKIHQLIARKRNKEKGSASGDRTRATDAAA